MGIRVTMSVLSIFVLLSIVQFVTNCTIDRSVLELELHQKVLQIIYIKNENQIRIRVESGDIVTIPWSEIYCKSRFSSSSSVSTPATTSATPQATTTSTPPSTKTTATSTVIWLAVVTFLGIFCSCLGIRMYRRRTNVPTPPRSSDIELQDLELD